MMCFLMVWFSISRSHLVISLFSQTVFERFSVFQTACYLLIIIGRVCQRPSVTSWPKRKQKKSHPLLFILLSASRFSFFALFPTPAQVCGRFGLDPCVPGPGIELLRPSPGLQYSPLALDRMHQVRLNNLTVFDTCILPRSVHNVITVYIITTRCFYLCHYPPPSPQKKVWREKKCNTILFV